MSSPPPAPPLPSRAHPGLPLAPTSTHAPGPGTHVFASQIIASRSGQPIIIPASSSPSSLREHNSARTASASISTKPIVSVPRLPLPSSPSPENARAQATIPSASVGHVNRLPRVGDVVLARVLRVRVRQVEVGVLCVGVEESGNSGGAGREGRREAGDGQRGQGEGGGGGVGVGVGVGGGQGEISWAVNADAYPAVIRREDVRATEKEKIVTGDLFRVGDLVRAVVISLGDQANHYLSTARNEYGVLMAKSEEGNTMAPISWREFRDEVTGRREARKVAKPF